MKRTLFAVAVLLASVPKDGAAYAGSDLLLGRPTHVVSSNIN